MSEREQAQAREAELAEETRLEAAPPEEDLTGPQNAKERFYEKLVKRFHITKKGMDIVLVVLIVLFLLFFVLGALKGNNIL